MVIFYLAINNEPDYMTKNQKKAAAAADNQDIQDRTRRFSDKGCKRTAAG